jgi:flagellar biosynthesis/type III secretory pathway M-ring protein FliF/YscJ
MAQLWDKSQKQWIKNFWLNLKNNNKNAGGKNYKKKKTHVLISVSFFISCIIAVVVRCHRHTLQTIYGSNTENGRQTIFLLLFYFSNLLRTPRQYVGV